MTNINEASPEVQLYAANGDTDAKTAFIYISNMHPATRRSWTKMGNAAARLIAEAEKRAMLKGMEMALEASKRIPACPFDTDCALDIHEPCPVCGDTGEIDAESSELCGTAAAAICALIAQEQSK